MFVVIIKLKSLSVVTHTYTIANAIVSMKLRPILTGKSQITACERKLLFVKETFESKKLARVGAYAASERSLSKIFQQKTFSCVIDFILWRSFNSTI